MMFRIYHASRDLFHSSCFFRDESHHFGLGHVLAAVLQGQYFHAGTINAKDLDEAYHFSQNHVPGNDIAWGDGHQRSTSVGDILVDGYGTTWVVASLGFTLLGQANTALFDKKNVPLILSKVVTKVTP